MRKFAVLFLGISISAWLNGDCNETSKWQRVTVKHKEPNGLGYDSGYTSIDFFFANSFQPQSMNFLDLRTHMLNNGGFALNAGLGWRHLFTNKLPVLFGINGYYDYRLKNTLSFNQIGLGFELLNPRWEARINGYLPLGQQGRIDTGATNVSYTSYQFYQHYLLIGQSNRFNSLGEIDSEIGVHFWPFSKKDFDVYLGAGPYYLQVPHGDAAAGFAARLALSMSRYISATGTYSYDRFYKNIGQAEIGFNLPFGREEEIDPNHRISDCNLAYFLNKRASQDVYRQEIIPILAANGDLSYAIDPRTNLPYYFVFVNNTSHSAGTYESPYPTFLEAQNNSKPYDVIYVYPGDGTTTGMNSGLMLQHDQWMFGAAIPHPIPILGISTPFVIPPLAANTPHITNTIDGVIQLADNNVVSGFFVDASQGAGIGIGGFGVLNPILDQNRFIGSASTGSIGIELYNPSGEVDITNSVFQSFTQLGSDFGGCGAIVVVDGATVTNLNYSGNTVSDIYTTGSQPAAGLLVIASSGTLEKVEMKQNSVQNIGIAVGSASTFGLGVLVTGGEVGGVVVDSCTFANGANQAIFTGVLNVAGSIDSLEVTNCSFDNLDGTFGILAQAEASTLFSNVLITNNQFTNIGTLGTFPTAAAAAVLNGGTMGTFTVTNCSFDSLDSGSAGFAELNMNGGTISAFNVNNCTFKNVSQGFGVLVQLQSGSNIVDTIDIQHNQFNTITNARAIAGYFTTGTVNEVLVENNIVTNISGTASSCEMTVTLSGSTVMGIQNNSFSGSGIDGWATKVVLDTGDVCLALKGNTATPPTASNKPFHLEVTGSGVLDVESNNGGVTGVQNLNNGAAVDASGVQYVTPGTCQ